MRILGGLMALGYEIGTIMKRTSIVYSDSRLTVKLDNIEGMGKQFVQVCLPPRPSASHKAGERNVLGILDLQQTLMESEVWQDSEDPA